MHAREYFLSSAVAGLLFSFILAISNPSGDALAGEALSSSNKNNPESESRTQLVDRLVKTMQYGDERDKEDAVIALGMIGDSKAVTPLCEYLQHTTNRNMQVVIIRALGRIGSAEATPALVKVLETDDYEFARVAAAEALGEIANNDAIVALEGGLKDKSLRVRRRCADVLKKITGEEYTYEGKGKIPTFEGYYKRLEELKATIKPTPEPGT